MKILHTADLHLRQVDDERWETLHQLLLIAKEQNIDVFVISGDLFDKNVKAETIGPKMRGMFSNNGFDILLIPGNHDPGLIKGLYFGEDVKLLTNLLEPYERENVSFWGMPFEEINEEGVLDRLFALKEKLSPARKNILLYHGELLDTFYKRDDFGDEPSTAYMPLRLSSLIDFPINYILAGHFHRNFDIRPLPSGGYFVYPGSPISITRREVGRRKVNVFKVGEPPKELLLDTPHFEEIVVDLNPSDPIDPLEIISQKISSIHPNAFILLMIKGYINKEVLQFTEQELDNRINEHIDQQRVEIKFEVKDIARILEDDLYKSFVKKLDETESDEDRRARLKELAVQAMIEALS